MMAAGRGVIGLLTGDRQAGSYFDLNNRGLAGSFIALLLVTGLIQAQEKAMLDLALEPLEKAADFLDTAQAIAGLDFVVSTESAVAHLAAAMGVRTCVLAMQDSHWSWSSWYPDVTVCPQREAGNWNGPMADVANVLLALPAAA